MKNLLQYLWSSCRLTGKSLFRLIIHYRWETWNYYFYYILPFGNESLNSRMIFGSYWERTGYSCRQKRAKTIGLRLVRLISPSTITYPQTEKSLLALEIRHWESLISYICLIKVTIFGLKHVKIVFSNIFWWKYL